MLGGEGSFSRSAVAHTCSWSTLCIRSSTSAPRSKRSSPDGGRPVSRRLGAGAEADGPLSSSLKHTQADGPLCKSLKRIGVGTMTFLGSDNISARCCQKHGHVTDSIQRSRQARRMCLVLAIFTYRRQFLQHKREEGASHTHVRHLNLGLAQITTANIKSDIRKHLQVGCLQALVTARGNMNSILPRPIGLETTMRLEQAVALDSAPARKESTCEVMSLSDAYMADRPCAQVPLRTVHHRVSAAIGSRGCPVEWNALKVQRRSRGKLSRSRQIQPS